MSSATRHPRWKPAAIAAAVTLAGAQARAQTPPVQDETVAQTPAQQVTVTGSNVRRTDTETPSPVDIITAADIKRSGYTDIADVLHNITANNMGSLSQSAPSAFAAGGSGVALRGLTVGATLVLIDGHRMAPYPMPDDGERNFVDISSIPLDAVERIEVLKDGASSVYGSDAIAGVVNVILKKSFVGTTVGGEAGVSSHGDGATVHGSFIQGWGDLAQDGYNMYVAIEARHQNAILLKKRPYLAITDWRPYGGVDLTQGTASGADSGSSTGAGSGTGYLTDQDGNPVHYYPGCTAAQAAADTCGYVNPYQTLQPSTTNFDVMSRYTTNLSGGWQGNIQASVLRSEAHQVGLYNNAAATGMGEGGNGGGLNLFKFGPGQSPVPAFPNQFPYVVTVPSNYPGNPTGTDAPLVYDFPDLGPLEQTTQSTSYRFVGELAGALGDWDINASVGATRVETRGTFYHYIDFPALQSALDSLSYIVGGNNPQSILNTIAPGASSTSASDLQFFSLRGTHELMDLGGGPLTLGTGLDITHRDLRQIFPNSFVQGQQAIGIYSFASGAETVTAGYAELVAPVTKQLELDASARFDHYDTFGNATTPKAGFKWRPAPEFVLRGTYSRGFRAPNSTEIGDAGSTSGFVGNLHDPLYCPGGTEVPNPPPGLLDPCNIALQELQLSSKHLDPEKSTSFTLGAIFEPNKTYNATIDYYRIQIRNQIISIGQLGQIGLDDAATLGTIIYRDNVGNVLYDTYPFINANTTTTSGIDLDLVGRWNLPDASRLKAELQVSYMLQYDLTAQGVKYHLAGTHGPAFVSEDTGTPRTRGAFTLTWSTGPLELSGTVNYISSYSVLDPSEDISDCGTAIGAVGDVASRFCRVPSFTELNVTGSYAVNPHLSLHAGVINLLDKHAPYDLQTFGAPGNGAQQGGAPYNPSYHQDGAVGPMITVGATYTF